MLVCNSISAGEVLDHRHHQVSPKVYTRYMEYKVLSSRSENVKRPRGRGSSMVVLSLFSSCPAIIANTCNLSIGQGKKMDLFSTGPKPKWNPNVKPFQHCYYNLVGSFFFTSHVCMYYVYSSHTNTHIFMYIVCIYICILWLFCLLGLVRLRLRRKNKYKTLSIILLNQKNNGK